MSMPPTLTTREGLREAIAFDLRDKAEAALQRVSLEEGDVWNGVQVLTAKAIGEVFDAVFGLPLPPPSETVVEVATPATVEVTARCPRCSITTVIEMEINEELRVSSKASSLHLSGKAKAKTHVCGQMNLPEAKDAPVDGQEAFALEDVVTEDLEGDQAIADVVEGAEDLVQAVGSADLPNGGTSDDPECDWPGCTRHAFHRGRHQVPVVLEVTPIPKPDGFEDDDDLLPA